MTTSVQPRRAHRTPEERRAATAAWMREWRRNNPDKVAATRQRWRERHKAATPPAIKRCRKCGETKPVTAFYTQPSGDGHSSRCKDCTLDQQNARRRALRPPRPTFEERFWAKVQKTETCWLWTAGRFKAGYGHMTGFDGDVVAHRIAYRLLVGPIPEGLQLDHLCKVTSCCNPAHLEPVTAQVNMLRGSSFSAKNAQKTHCPKGHPYAGDNLRFVKGRRVCQACTLDSKRKRRLKEREAAASLTP